MQDDMNFANNMEAMAFDKSSWAIVETSADGKTIYMGKPCTNNAKTDEAAWCIKRIVKTEGSDGSQTIETRMAQPQYKCKWDERQTLDYKYY